MSCSIWQIFSCDSFRLTLKATMIALRLQMGGCSRVGRRWCPVISPVTTTRVKQEDNTKSFPMNLVQECRQVVAGCSSILIWTRIKIFNQPQCPLCCSAINMLFKLCLRHWQLALSTFSGCYLLVAIWCYWECFFVFLSFSGQIRLGANSVGVIATSVCSRADTWVQLSDFLWNVWCHT